MSVVYSKERRAALSKQMKKAWKDGKIRPRITGRSKNKSEAKLSPVLESLGFRYTGNGSHWIAKTQSGIRRNPDFIYKSAKLKIAFLLNATYYHRNEELLKTELADYLSAGWRVLIFWVTNRVCNWHLPIVLKAANTFVNGRKSLLSSQGQIQQFTILSATRTITSWPLES